MTKKKRDGALLLVALFFIVLGVVAIYGVSISTTGQVSKNIVEKMDAISCGNGICSLKYICPEDTRAHKNTCKLKVGEEFCEPLDPPSDCEIIK